MGKNNLNKKTNNRHFQFKSIIELKQGQSYQCSLNIGKKGTRQSMFIEHWKKKDKAINDH